jgi:hypothetical protein
MVEVYKKTEKQIELENKIFSIYSKLQEETSRDRRQVDLGQLWKLVSQWCNDYRYFKNYKKVQKMGYEIYMILCGCVRKELKDIDSFFK